MSTSATRDILSMIGCKENWNSMTDEPPGYILDLGNIELAANQVLGRSFRQVFLFTGTARNQRSLKIVQFELPVECDSFEQGVALIVRGIGDTYEPEKPAPWFALGRKWQDRLPAFGGDCGV